ncbi:uncharacterized protein LOC117119601 [Anneissia japonica]|uniref:uncharacterized protein LOC117119601 n=1 Tax=Anneissia japonica TaxID=1529436 RepID=UPI0014258377|nr:uncharacterized protein LOC117119601 [Anneissia japonica]
MESLLKQVLESIQSTGLEDLSPEDVGRLLAVGSSETLDETLTLGDGDLESLEEECQEHKHEMTEDIKKELERNNSGYPHDPLYLHLAHKLRNWMDSRSPDALTLPDFEFLNEGESVTERKQLFAALTPDVCEFKDLWNEDQLERKKQMLLTILKKLKKRGILALLGMRRTVGTLEMFPPTRSCLQNSFNQRHKLTCQLSVGARALSKHCHRDQTASWWATSTGSEAAKNAHANVILNRILDEAVWINIHSLPHDVVALEVRCLGGYGARWTADGAKFRGFLEPQMKDGHSVGWRH